MVPRNKTQMRSRDEVICFLYHPAIQFHNSQTLPLLLLLILKPVHSNTSAYQFCVIQNSIITEKLLMLRTVGLAQCAAP